MKKIHLGKKFNNLLVISESPSEKRKDGNGTFAKWECLCDCGNKTIVRANALVSGTTKSCGCICGSIKLTRKQPAGFVGMMRVFRSYKESCNKRGIDFNLDLVQFKILTKQDCHYCGGKPSTTAGSWNEHSTYIYNGIDRTDNSIGYYVENCVTCCNTCNKAKHIMTYDNFIKWLDNLVEFRNNRR